MGRERLGGGSPYQINCSLSIIGDGIILSAPTREGESSASLIYSAGG